jgi:FKBP-type peptidyl-prolyl cis-trans isomerase 2
MTIPVRTSRRLSIALLVLALLQTAVIICWAGPSAAGVDSRVSDGAKVRLAFTITIPETDTIIPNNVREFVSGRHEIFPAVERALTGMKTGDEKRIDLQPDDAFGTYDAAKKVSINREMLPPDVGVGTILKSSSGVLLTVVEMLGTAAIIDYNHPLAGKHVVLDVKILEVQ